MKKKGHGTNESLLITTLAKVPAHELVNLNQSYKGMFGKDIIHAIHKETSGGFQKLLEALVKGSFVLDAEALRKAVKGLGTDEDVVIELLSARSNSDMYAQQLVMSMVLFNNG